MKAKKILYNIVFGFFSKLISFALALFIPRLLISSYGSEVNGLFSSVSNIYTYMALAEAGFAASSLHCLYSPIAKRDYVEANSILASTRKAFRKVSLFYLFGVVVLAIAFPFVFQTTINKWDVFGIVALQGFSSLLNFFILAGMTVVFSADGKEYIGNNIFVFTSVLSGVAKIICVNLHVEITLLQSIYLSVSLISIFLNLFFLKRKYPWINWKQKDNGYVLKQSSYFFLAQASYLVFNNTDVILISIFLGLKETSVYSVYNLVFSSLLSLVSSMFGGLKFMLGQTYSEGKEKYIILHDAFKSYYCATIFSLFSVCYILILPFVRLYTAGVTDISYIDPYLPILFTLVNLLSNCRSTENSLIGISFHVKETNWRTALEAVINLVVSIVLVIVFPLFGINGMYGCLIGTIVALLYRTNDMIIYANLVILQRKPVQAYLTILPDFALFAVVVVFTYFVDLYISNYYSFLAWGIGLSLIMFLLYFTLNSLTCLRGFKFVLLAIKKRIKRKKEGSPS